MNDRYRENLRSVMAEVCNSGTFAEAIAIYRSESALLRGCKFVFASESGATPGFAVNRAFSAGAAVKSLFNTEKVLVLDQDTVLDMETGAATYPIDFSISLDTEALSYLEPYLGGRTSRLPPDFNEVFEFMARDEVNVDPLPYIHENMMNISSARSARRVFEKLKAYEVLRTIDATSFRASGVVRSTQTEAERAKRAQEQVARMFRERGDHGALAEFVRQHHTLYILLLKMAHIHLAQPGMPVEQKMSQFLEFCDSEMATIFARESIVARAYFERGQNLKFFGKVQANKDDLFWVLNGMAWDLWHVRLLEKAMTLRPAREARYFFPALLTFDKRLIEIIDLYPLKACAFVEGESEPMPFFEGDLLERIAGNTDAQEALLDRYYSAEARNSRDRRRAKARASIGTTLKALETALWNVSGGAQVCPLVS